MRVMVARPCIDIKRSFFSPQLHAKSLPFDLNQTGSTDSPGTASTVVFLYPGDRPVPVLPPLPSDYFKKTTYLQVENRPCTLQDESCKFTFGVKNKKTNNVHPACMMSHCIYNDCKYTRRACLTELHL